MVVNVDNLYPKDSTEVLTRMPVSIVGIQPSLSQRFKEININYVSDLMDLDVEHELSQVDRVGQKTLKKLIELVTNLKMKNWTINELTSFNFMVNITCVPSELRFVDGQDIVDIVFHLPNIVKLLKNDNEREFNIITHRFGLDGNSVYTLEELGNAFGLTRERIRQIEKKALSKLRAILIHADYGTKSTYRLNEYMRYEVRNIYSEIVEKFSLITLDDIMEKFSQKYNKTLSEPYISLLLEIFEYKELIKLNRYAKRTWIVEKKQVDVDLLIRCSNDMLSFLQNNPKRFTAFNLLVELNKSKKGKKYNPTVIEHSIRILKDIQGTSEVGYQLKIEALSSYEAIAYRVLFDIGGPMRLDELVREINHRLALAGSKRRVTNRLSARFSGNNWFVPQGRSGVWALSEWDNINTNTILELMQTFLYKENKAVFVQDIYDYVRSQRPVSRASITLYLGTNELFEQFSEDKWGLSVWDKSQRPLDETGLWNVEAVAEFVSNYFQKSQTRTVLRSDLELALAEEMGKPARTARGKLNYCPAVKTMSDNGILYAKFVRNYREIIEEGDKRYKNRKTIRSEVQKTIRDILGNSPNFALSVGDLKEKVVRKTQCNPTTFFAYLYEMDDVEPRQLDGVTKRVLVTQSAIPKFAQLKDISDDKLRGDIERAISFLTVDGVDVSLFQLAKVFENTLKQYLLAARVAKLFTVNNNDLKTLANMISKVSREEIITDTTALNFLRLERNERVHGEIPNIEECRVMLKNSKQFADMYIDYTKLLFDRFSEINNEV